VAATLTAHCRRARTADKVPAGFKWGEALTCGGETERDPQRLQEDAAMAGVPGTVTYPTDRVA
jgi:hypothetical protein